MPQSWRSLNLPHARVDNPPLAFRFEVKLSEYTIWLTDLTYIWKESMDRKQIIQRAFAIDTSIDPSEGPGQLRLLLESIESALERRPGTALTVEGDKGEKMLVLRTFTPLPGSLNPLEWFSELKSVPQPRLTTEFVLPILDLLSISNAENASLLLHLKEKDQVIAKLVDKMQSDGIDLSKVFPGAALSYKTSPKANVREIFGKSVKGLAVFNDRTWRINSLKDEAPKTPQTVLSDVLCSNALSPKESARLGKNIEWWKNLDFKDWKPKSTNSQNIASQREEALVPDDDFQRQVTPVKSQTQAIIVDKGSGGVGSQIAHDYSSTTEGSDDDLGFPAPKATPQKSQESGAHARDSQGNLEGREQNRKRTSKPIDMSSNISHSSRDALKPPIEKSAPLGSDEQTTGLSKISSPESKAAVHDNSSSSRPIPKSKSKLGKIGGKSKLDQKISSQIPSQHSESVALKEPQRNASINRENMKDEPRSRAAVTQRSDSAAVQSKTPSPPRETSQERADRKRKELKHELEQKSHAGKKKKRKF